MLTVSLVGSFEEDLVLPLGLGQLPNVGQADAAAAVLL